MAKESPFASLVRMPAKARQGALISSVSVVPEEVEVVTFVPPPAENTNPTLIRPPREPRTTNFDPEVLDAVQIELKRQKRARLRSSSTLSSLLDELLRDWLAANSSRPKG